MIDKTIHKILEAEKNGELATDSRVVDFAKANRLRYSDILCCVASNSEDSRECWGCEHIVNRCYYDVNGTPCNSCSRYRKVKDNFKPSNKRYRAKDAIA